MEKFVISFVAGASTAVLYTPYSIAIIASQNSGKLGDNNTLKKIGGCRSLYKIIEKFGPRAIFRGFIPTALSNGVFATSLFYASPYLSKKIEMHYSVEASIYKVLSATIASIIPATICTLVFIPLDLIAISEQNDPSRKKCPSGLQAVKKIYLKDGIHAFKVGYIANLISVIIDMTAYNLFREIYLNKLENPKQN